MKKITFFLLTIIAITSSASASIQHCTIDEVQSDLKDGVKYWLKHINPNLDLSTVEIAAVGKSNFYNLLHFEYKISVKDKNGQLYSIGTFTQDRKTNAIGTQVGGLFTSDVFVVKGDGKYFPDQCESQYLSFTSLWFNDDQIYITRLLDDKGREVHLNSDYDSFDRALRSLSVDIQ